MMKNTKQDRRSQRTRHLLTAALTELMLEKQFDTITVQDILERANVGRSTFYGHYTCKDDLLFSSIGQMLHSFDQHPTGNANSATKLLPSLELFRHVQEYKRLYKALVWGRGIDLIHKNFQGQLSRLVEHNLTLLYQGNDPPDVPLSALANFVAGSFLTMLQWWVDSNIAYSPEQIDEMFQQMIQPGVRSILGLQQRDHLYD
jgi:AcrR family transcriptional regulator